MNEAGQQTRVDRYAEAMEFEAPCDSSLFVHEFDRCFRMFRIGISSARVSVMETSSMFDDSNVWFVFIKFYLTGEWRRRTCNVRD